MAKGQLRSNREKKKPKAEKNKKKTAPVPSVFERMIGKDVSGKKFSLGRAREPLSYLSAVLEWRVTQSASIPQKKVRSGQTAVSWQKRSGACQNGTICSTRWKTPSALRYVHKW